MGAGVPFAWINKRLRAQQLADIVETAKAEYCVVDSSSLLALPRAVALVPELKRLIWLVLPDGRVGGGDAVRMLTSLADRGITARMIHPGAPQRALATSSSSHDIGCCLFTSGSTGRQKGVLVGESDLFARAASESDWYSLSDKDRLLSLLPFSFDVGLNQLMSALLAGALVVIQESWLPRDVVRTIASESITGISGVPAIWRDLLSTPEKELVSLSKTSLRYATVSGGSLSINEQSQLQDLLPDVGIFKTYGQTETFRSASLRPDELRHRPSSVGKPYATAKIFVLKENGEPCNPEEQGEVVHTGLGTMLGYVGVASDAKLRPLPAHLGGEIAVYTGDLGHLDADGYLFLKGRRDGMLKIFGNRVYPEEVAHHLESIPIVHEVEVVTSTFADADPHLTAWVVCRRQTTDSELRRAAAERLPSYMVPHRFVMVQRIPRLANGKADRVALSNAASKLSESS